MSISYSSVVGFGSGKVTLPSVETWGNNMNILRDPPKSIYTRKIDKVGETSEITQMIDDASDRACEAILVYPRGVNPMVAVSYDNYGNNGGQKSGNVSQAGFNVNGGSGKQAYLPYRIMDRGSFRPPVKDQRDILPLSRLPRDWTSSFSQPGFADFSKKAFCPGDDYKAIKTPEHMLKACIRPTATYTLETPVIENYEVKYVLKNPIQVSGHSGIQPNARFNGEIGQPVKMVENPIHPDINVNQSSKNAPWEYIHDDIDLERVLPYHESRTNNSYNIHTRLDNQAIERTYIPNHPATQAVTNNGGSHMQTTDEISSRKFYLRPTVNPGSFDSVPSVPVSYHENSIQELDLQKSRMRKSIYEMQKERNSANPYQYQIVT